MHLGLVLLFFIWLFSLSGLILNHGNWKFASFWEERNESKTEFTLPLYALDQPDIENQVLKLLAIKGEVQQVKRTPGVVEFSIQSPGIAREVHIDLRTGAGTQKVLKYNLWGKLRTLHTFNGMKDENPAQSPNWLVTNIWRFTMDGIAFGLIIITVSSWIMWFKIRKEYKFGYLALFSGFAFAAYFIFG